MIWNPEKECLSRKEYDEIQLERLKWIVNRAYERVPFYKRRFDEIGLKPEHINTLKDIEKTAPTNPNFEVVLKRNISNKYCSQPAYELAAYPFADEAKAYFDLLSSGEKVDYSEFRKSIYLKFEQTPLANMQPGSIPEPDEIISDIAKYLIETINISCF